jgi:hypothetical protein
MGRYAEVLVAHFKVLYQHFPEGTENLKKNCQDV